MHNHERRLKPGHCAGDVAHAVRPSGVPRVAAAQNRCDPSVWVGSAGNTVFAGPWGISYTANRTPDPDAGLDK